MGLVGQGAKDILTRIRQSRRLVLVIVFIALFLDNMLLTTVVPIIPDFLYRLDHPEAANQTALKEMAAKYVNARVALTHDNIVCYNISSPLSMKLAKLNGEKLPYFAKLSKYYGRKPMREYACFNHTWTVSNTSNIDALLADNRHTALVKENLRVGLLFASKAIMQLIANPFIGPLTSRIGYSVPMFVGFVVMMASTVTFAFAKSYAVLFVARAIQGIGSSCSSVSGMGMLAERYPDDQERGNAMGLALGGLALGVLVGPPYGGVMYQFVSKEAAFLLLAALAVLDGGLQLLLLQPSIKTNPEDAPSLKALLLDPYILIASGSITIANMGIAMMEPSLPLWMMDTMNAPRWQQGAAFLPASISYLIGTNLFGPLGHRIGRWLSSLLGMAIIGICLIAIPFARNITHLIAPNFGLGLAIGMVDSTMMPLMGHLVDLRHASVYGSVYAIADIAFCLGFAIGPALSGPIVQSIGFPWMLWIIAMVNLIYLPLLIFLRSPPPKEEKMSLLMNETVKYVTYNKEDSDTELLNDERNGYQHIDKKR